MSQSFWETEAGEQAQAEVQTMPEQQTEQPHEEMTAEPVAGSGALAVSGDEFAALEERVQRAVNLVKRERQSRAAAEERAALAEAQLREQGPLVEHLQNELNVLRAERDHVRQRVERLLGQLDALEL
jgi:hypothetical protein